MLQIDALPAWLSSAGVFVAGALTTGLAAEVARRYFDRPRLHISVADLTLTRTRDRFHMVLEIEPELRRLLADWRVQDLNWVKTFYCEDDLDVGILDTIHREEILARTSADFSRMLQLLPNVDISELIFNFACDNTLLNTAKNGVLKFRDKIPKPTPQPDARVLFDVIQRTVDVEGRECHYVQLDLVGNATPIVGDENGDEYVNERLAPLVYALSTGDKELLARILNVAKEYADLARQKYRAIRDDLVKVKDSINYLAADVVITNVGKEPALLSQQVLVRLGRSQRDIALAYVEYAVPTEKRSSLAALRDEAVRIRQTYGVKSTLLDRFDSPLSQLVVQPGEARTIKFVSLEPLISEHRDAVQAARTGHLDFQVTVTQAVAKQSHRLAMLARYRYRIRRSQRLSPRSGAAV